jgi:uncharacterized iron-regulated membrane protein
MVQAADSVPGRRRYSWRSIAAQLHLWSGLVLAVYVFVLSLSGSLIVLRPLLHRWITQPVIAVQGDRLTAQALDEALHRTYPGLRIESVRQPRRPGIPDIVTLAGNGETRERLFDPYAAVDIGNANPLVLRVVEWLVDLHDNLLAGRKGRMYNGIGGTLLTIVALTGLIIWWPGNGRWSRALSPGRPAWSARFANRLHVAVGFWISGLVLVWSLTAVYFAFPDVFERLIDLLDTDPDDDARPGEQVLETMVRLHFGRFGGLAGRLAWMALGLLPAALAVTGFIMWLKRRAVRNPSGNRRAAVP